MCACVCVFVCFCVRGRSREFLLGIGIWGGGGGRGGEGGDILVSKHQGRGGHIFFPDSGKGMRNNKLKSSIVVCYRLQKYNTTIYGISAKASIHEIQL